MRFLRDGLGVGSRDGLNVGLSSAESVKPPIGLGVLTSTDLITWTLPDLFWTLTDFALGAKS